METAWAFESGNDETTVVEVKQETPEELKERLFDFIDIKIKNIELANVTKDLKDKWKEQLLALKERFLIEYESYNQEKTSKNELNELKSELSGKFYFEAVLGIETNSTSSQIMKAMYYLDKEELTPANKDKPFKYDRKKEKVAFDQKNTEFLGRMWKDGFSGEKLIEKIVIEGVENEDIYNMINYIFLSTNNSYALTEALILLDKFKTEEGDKFILIDLIFSRLNYDKINTKNAKELVSLKKSLNILKEYPKHFLKLFEMIEIVSDNDTFLIIEDFVKNDSRLLSALMGKTKIENDDKEFKLFGPKDINNESDTIGLEGKNSEIDKEFEMSPPR